MLRLFALVHRPSSAFTKNWLTQHPRYLFRLMAKFAATLALEPPFGRRWRTWLCGSEKNVRPFSPETMNLTRSECENCFRKTPRCCSIKRHRINFILFETFNTRNKG